MIILLRQSGVKLGTASDGELRLRDALFLRVKFVEILSEGVVMLPAKGEDNFGFVEKVNTDCWREPITGLAFDYFEIRSDKAAETLPRHLEIQAPPTRQF